MQRKIIYIAIASMLGTLPRRRPIWWESIERAIVRGSVKVQEEA